MSTERKRKRAERQFVNLELRAEALISGLSDTSPDEVLRDTKEMIHQLRVYQAELEIQNEELRLAQEELLDSRDRFSMLFHQAPVGYISIDHNGVVREANLTLTTMLHLTMADIINKPLVEFIHPSDRDIFLGRFRAIFQSPAGKTMEIRLDCAHHSTCHALFEWRSVANMGKADSTVLLTISDITERKRAEKKLYLAHSALESTIEGVIITDAAGTIVDINRAFERVTGYGRDEAIGNNPNMLSSGRQKPGFYQKLWQTLQKKGQWQGQIWNKRKNGEIYPEHLSITAIRTRNGPITNFVGVFSDITEQLSIEEQLLQSQKMESIGTLVGGIAHDFNNMLGGITGNLFLAKRKAEGQPALLKHLNHIGELAKQSSTMVAQMLAFARKGMVEMKDLSLRPFFDKVLALSQVSLPENIDFNFKIKGSDPLVVHGDTIQLQQVIINLLNNARDAVIDAPSPRIRLRISTYHADSCFHRNHPDLTANDFVHISLKDNGCGIAKAHLPQIFEPFFSTKEVGKGTGLGLAMCFGTLQSHDGTISVESQQGVGTTFHIYLPLQKRERAAENKKSQKEIVGSSAVITQQANAADGEWILLADDAERVREPCAEVLTDMGYHVLQAEDGRHAFTIFEQHHERIALAILDVVMPYCSGPELAVKMRNIKPELPILFATGYDKNSVLDPKHPMKNCRVLTKPYSFDDMEKVIKQHLQPSIGETTEHSVGSS